MFSRRWWWTTFLVLGSIALAIRLGIWQLDRHAQSLAIVEHLKSVQAMSPLVLDGTGTLPDLAQMEYRQVVASGVYDFAHQVALRNQVWTQSWGDEPGFALLTPLVLPGGQAVLVERGWVPFQYDTPASWRQLDEAGTVTVEGIIRLGMEKGEMGGGIPDPTLVPGETRMDFWNFVNLERIQLQMPYQLLNIYIQQAPNGDQVVLPYRWLPHPDLSAGTHLGFALMWFFFASLLLFGYPVWLKKRE